jgi:hypothetical protein
VTPRQSDSDEARAMVLKPRHGPRPGSVLDPLPSASPQFGRVGRTIRPDMDVLREVTPLFGGVVDIRPDTGDRLVRTSRAGATPPLFLDESPLRRRRPSQFGTNRSATRRSRAPETRETEVRPHARRFDLRIRRTRIRSWDGGVLGKGPRERTTRIVPPAREARTVTIRASARTHPEPIAME